MKTILFNPFRYIAGIRSLIFGILILLTTAVVAFFSHTHFPDLISVKIGANFPFGYFVLQGLVNWLVFSIILYLLSLIFSSSSLRIVDVFGTQAMARFPYLIAAFLSFPGSLDKFGKYIMWSTLHYGDEVHLSGLDMVVAITLMILSLLLTIWMIVLMVNALRVSANLKGTKLTTVFLIAFISSVIITVVVNRLILLPTFS